MAVINGSEYIERINKLKQNVYENGKNVQRDDQRFAPAINIVKFSFDAAFQDDHKALVCTRSNFNGNETISRFNNLNKSAEDLIKKQEMIRKLAPLAGGCIQRCMSNDILNALGITTEEIDKTRGTDYHARFLKYAEYYQKYDLIAAGAQTDAKGDRSKRPHEQVDPDLYLRIIERRKDGTVVNGAKIHSTIAACADEILVIPTRALTDEEENWAVAFAIPADTEGVKLITRVTTPRPRYQIKSPYNEMAGWAESFIIFDKVFVPKDRIFMCGEWEFGARLALLFANYHRHSYTGCKPGITDMIMGACALAAEYNGVSKAPHITNEITELMMVAELIYAAGIAAAARAKCTPSGIYEPDLFTPTQASILRVSIFFMNMKHYVL